MKSFVLVAVIIGVVMGCSAKALASSLIESGRWDVDIEYEVSPHSTYNCVINFTKDGVIIGSKACQLVNDTDKPLKKRCKATAPKGTNDRDYDANCMPLEVKGNSWLPPFQIDDYGKFLSDNGFKYSQSALASPMVLGDDNHNGILDAGDVSIFASIHDVGVFATVANQANFPLGSTLNTGPNGQVSGLPGITFYLDESHTTPYASKQLIVQGISSEYCTVIPTVSEWGLIILAALLLATGTVVIVRRRQRVAA
jgi:hypothetical protein